jgi:hypothetical protein
MSQRTDIDFAMTFDEIGKREGISRGGAYMAYVSAMRKLRSRKAQFLVLLEMHHELDSHRFGNDSAPGLNAAPGSNSAPGSEDGGAR